MKVLGKNRMQETGFAAVSRLFASDSPQFHRESAKRTHLSRLSTPRHGAVRRKQTGQAAQIDREHRQREHVADLTATTQLHLANRAAVLLAIAEQRLDHLADDLAGEVARMARGASVDAALAPRPFAGLGVILVGVLRDVRGDVALAAARHETAGVEVLVGTDRLALLARQTVQHPERGLMLGRATGQRESGVDSQLAAV